jgi:hypothetical protein
VLRIAATQHCCSPPAVRSQRVRINSTARTSPVSSNTTLCRRQVRDPSSPRLAVCADRVNAATQSAHAAMRSSDLTGVLPVAAVVDRRVEASTLLRSSNSIATHPTSLLVEQTAGVPGDTCFWQVVASA